VRRFTAALSSSKSALFQPDRPRNPSLRRHPLNGLAKIASLEIVVPSELLPLHWDTPVKYYPLRHVRSGFAVSQLSGFSCRPLFAVFPSISPSEMTRLWAMSRRTHFLVSHHPALSPLPPRDLDPRDFLMDGQTMKFPMPMIPQNPKNPHPNKQKPHNQWPGDSLSSPDLPNRQPISWKSPSPGPSPYHRQISPNRALPLCGYSAFHHAGTLVTYTILRQTYLGFRIVGGAGFELRYYFSPPMLHVRPPY